MKRECRDIHGIYAWCYFLFEQGCPPNLHLGIDDLKIWKHCYTWFHPNKKHSHHPKGFPWHHLHSKPYCMLAFWNFHISCYDKPSLHLLQFQEQNQTQKNSLKCPPLF